MAHALSRPRICQTKPVNSCRAPWRGGHATTQAGPATAPRSASPLEDPEGPRPPPAPALHHLACLAPSGSTTSDGGSPRAVSPRWTSKDNVRASGHAHERRDAQSAPACCTASCCSYSMTLTRPSPGIVHHSHPRPGRWRISPNPASTERTSRQQKSANHHDLCAKYGQSQAAQGQRKRQWHLLHWKILAHGGTLCCRELRTSGAC